MNKQGQTSSKGTRKDINSQEIQERTNKKQKGLGRTKKNKRDEEGQKTYKRDKDKNQKKGPKSKNKKNQGHTK